MKTLSFMRRLVLTVGSLLLMAGWLHAQGVTTSALTGFITTADGQPVAGAAVSVVHEPSGTRATTSTRTNGQYAFTGLRVGGPNTLVVEKEGFARATRDNLFLDVGQSATVNVELSVEVVQLDAVEVTASRDTIFGGKVGAGTSLSGEDIANTPTVRRNVQDMARLDSRLVLQSLDQGGQLSAQGQNFRYNSFLVDGVQANDSFGLNSNGFTSLRSPIPVNTLAGLSIELNPYDVRRSGFTGALINAVTKSGTNQFSGSLYYEFTNENMRADNPVTGVKDEFEETTWGFDIGGPIIKNKLFFYASYEDFSRTATPPNQNFVPTDASLTSISDRASALGYDVGGFSAANKSEQKSYLGKLDWNISDSQRLAVSYRRNDGAEPIFPSFSGNTGTSFSSYWYQQPRVTDTYTAQLFSTWTPDLRSEVTYSYAEYDGSPANNGPAFPEVIINGVPGLRRDTGANITNGSIRLGTEFSRQLNEITTNTHNGEANVEYSLGDHTLMGGLSYESRAITNKFVQAYLGSYTFSSVANWVSGNAASLQRAILAPGATEADAIAEFDFGMLGVYAQDTWKPNSRLTLTAGVRFDQQLLPDAPIAIPTTPTYSETSFRNAFGIASNTSPDGNNTLAPRFGFSYNFDTEEKTQVRGGLGLFQGRNPAVWISNAYSNRGVVARQSQSNVTFNPNVTTGTGTGGIPVINVTDPDFVQPVSWKGNLALDRELPWGGLTATLELGMTQVDQAPFVTNLNLKPVGTMPDGRIRYAGVITPSNSGASRSSASATYGSASLYQNPTFADVYYLTNTGKGEGYDVTLGVQRPLKNNWGWSLSYTRSDYTEVSPMTSSVAQSNYNARAVFNPNEDVDSTSNYNAKDKVVATLTKRFEFIKKAPTTFTLIYEGRSGRPYSWVFEGDANGDGFTNNDLLYVPSGPSDPRVSWASTTERDNFFAFAAASGLDAYAGGVVPRNSENSPWNQTFDLKISQVIPIYKRVQTELFVNFINFANLFDEEWGILDEVPFSYRRSVAGASYNAAGNNGAGVYNYTFSGSTLDGVPTVANDTPVSRWQIQVGVKLNF